MKQHEQFAKISENVIVETTENRNDSLNEGKLIEIWTNWLRSSQIELIAGNIKIEHDKRH